MRKFVLQVFLFVLFSGCFYMVALFLWGSFAPSTFKPNLNYRIGSYGHLYTRLSEVKTIQDIDILFLGSSHAYRGFDTRIYAEKGITSFNLGSSSQTAVQTKVLLQRYLKRLNPKLIIYEVYPTTFTIDGVESSLDLIANDKNDVYSLKMALELNNIKTYNTLLYGVMRDLLNLNKSFVEPIKRDRDTYITGGYVEQEIDHFGAVTLENKEIQVSPKQLESFSQILSYIQKEDIEVLLVYAPISPSNYSRFSNKLYFDSLMESYADYYNFNDLLRLDDSVHFYDSHHLNQYGVEVFNKKLLEILASR